MENEKESINKDDYALNTFKDIWKYDKARLLDLGNDFQVLLSQKDEDRNEEARARSNFLKLVEGERRPFSHTITDASRLLPDVIAALVGAGAKLAQKGISKAVGKAGEKAAKEATKGVAKKLINEGSSDAAKALSKSKFLTRDAKDMAGKAWVRNLFENKDAMERVAGRALKDNEVAAIKKNFKELIPDKVLKYNDDVDRLKEIYGGITRGNTFETKDDFLKFLSKNRKSLGLSSDQYERLVKNIESLPDYDAVKPSFSHLQPGRIMEPEKEIKEAFKLKQFGKDVWDVSKPILNNTAIKAVDSALNDGIASKVEAYKPAEIGPAYDYSGSEPTPVKDFLLGILDLDFNDPTRFNEKDIDAFMSFLGEKGFFEVDPITGRYVSDFWSPRQKVSYIRHQLSDKDKAELFKKYWLESEQRKELLNGEEE